MVPLALLALVPYVDFINHSPFSSSYVDAREIPTAFPWEAKEDEVVLFAPYYFSHLVALQMFGLRPRILPCEAASGVPSLGALRGALGATASARGRPPAVPVDDPVQDPGIERGRRRHVAPRHRNDVHAARQVAALARLDDPDDGKRLARGPRDDVRRARHRHADVARRPSPGRRGHVEGGQERGAEPGVGARRHVAAARPERVRRAAERGE